MLIDQDGEVLFADVPNIVTLILFTFIRFAILQLFEHTIVAL